VVTASGGWEGHEEKKGYTNLPRPFKLDDLVSILVNVNLFLRMVSPILDNDEQ
jgi:hypothetical protein